MMRFLLFIGCLIIAVACVAAPDQTRLRTYGDQDGILIYVFSSPLCPHCAAYHRDILPILKERFADTGKAQIKLADTPGDPRSLRVSAVARCLPDGAYHDFMTRVYQNQAEWGYGPDGEEQLKSYLADVPETVWKPCWDNLTLRQTVRDQRDNLVRQYRVTALPTTVVVRGTDSRSFLGADERIIDEIEGMIAP